MNKFLLLLLTVFLSTNLFAESTVKSKAASCKKGATQACLSLGQMYYYGEDVKKDDEKALHFLNVACKQDNASCSKAAVFYQEGVGANVDVSKAKKLYSLACDKKNGYGCQNLGIILAKGSKADARKAVKLFEKACSYGDSLGCHTIATVFDTGKLGVKQSYKQAAKYYQMACDKKYMVSCSNLGVLLYQGIDIKKDDKKALGYFNMACQGGYKKACKKADLLEGKKKR